MDGADEPQRSPGYADQLDGLVQLSVRRSQARAEVLRFVARRGPAYATLIAEGTGLHLNTVIGALRGAGDRYSEELSLLAVGLVEEVEPGLATMTGVSRFYGITEDGRMAVEVLGDGGQRSDA